MWEIVGRFSSAAMISDRSRLFVEGTVERINEDRRRLRMVPWGQGVHFSRAQEPSAFSWR